MNKLLLIFFSVLCIFATSQAADLIQENGKGEFSAQLDNVKLSEVTRFIEKKYNIQFKGADTQLETSITLSFEKLNLEQMLKKILSKTNFVFTYNKLGKVTEVTLLQTGDKKTGVASNQNVVQTKGLPMPAGLSPETPQGSNTAPDEISSFKDNTNSEPDEITSFKVVPNAPPPGEEQGKNKAEEPDPITSFKIIPNAPPPGN